MGTTEIIKTLIIGTFLILNSPMKSQSGNEYPINDPKNPNCPCHKLQKQAEDEFRNLLANANNNNNIISPQNADRNPIQQSSIFRKENNGTEQYTSAGSSFHSGTRTAHIKHKRKKSLCKHKKLHKIFDMQCRDILKKYRNVSACYHWN